MPVGIEPLVSPVGVAEEVVTAAFVDVATVVEVAVGFVEEVETLVEEVVILEEAEEATALG